MRTSCALICSICMFAVVWFLAITFYPSTEIGVSHLGTAIALFVFVAIVFAAGIILRQWKPPEFQSLIGYTLSPRMKKHKGKSNCIVYPESPEASKTEKLIK